MYMHFIMDGQSLSTGHQSYPTLSTENVPENYMISNQGGLTTEICTVSNLIH